MAFADCVHPIDLEIMNTTKTTMSAPYLDLHLEVDGEVQLRTERYDKRDNFNFPIVYNVLYIYM